MDEEFKNRGRPQLLPCEQDLELRLGLPRGEDKPRAISTGKGLFSMADLFLFPSKHVSITLYHLPVSLGPKQQHQVGFLQLQTMEVKDEAHSASGSAYGSLTRLACMIIYIMFWLELIEICSMNLPAGFCIAAASCLFPFYMRLVLYFSK